MRLLDVKDERMPAVKTRLVMSYLQLFESESWDCLVKYKFSIRSLGCNIPRYSGIEDEEKIFIAHKMLYCNKIMNKLHIKMGVAEFFFEI